jgi:hypothetical protein
MSSSRIDSTKSTVQIEQTRARQVEPPRSPFRDVLAGGANALMTGAEVATGVLGGPVLAAAVRQAKGDVVSSIAGQPGGGAYGGGGGGGTDYANAVLNGPPGSEMATMHAMQREAQSFNLQLLNLQEEVQTENRRFSTLTNVIRARHDTAKAAVSNVRA